MRLLNRGYGRSLNRSKTNQILRRVELLSPLYSEVPKWLTTSFRRFYHSFSELCVLYWSLYGYSEEKRLFTTPP